MRLSTLLLLLLALAFTSCADDHLTPTPAAPAPEEDLAAVARAEAEAEADLLAHEAAFGDKGHRVYIPAGSVDALAGAIAGAPRNAVIRLGAGDHVQNGTLVVDRPVNIVGEKGARLLISGVGPFPTDAPGVRAGIHVRETEFVRIRNLDIVPMGGPGGTAILAEKAPYTFVQNVVAENWQIGVAAEQSRKLYVDRSTFVGSSQWQTDPTFSVFGIVVVNGPNAQLYRNTIRNAVFGIWACDERGRLGYNNISGSFNGVELCKVPAGIPLPSGEVVGSELPATRWLVYNNTTNGNFNNGFEVIDGANNSLLVGNTSVGNGGLDYEFAGPTDRYGFPAPTSSNNSARLKPESSWADCGDRNRVRGGELIEDWTCY